MNTPNPWEEAYKIFKDEYTKEQIDKMKLGKIITLLSKRTKEPETFYWQMIHDIVTNPCDYIADS